jgi:nucleotide-binding universal stress UspA family protein
MNYIKKILVAIDFSDPSEKAFVVAADLSRQLDASLHVIHIVQIHASNIPESGRLDVDALHEKELQNAKENLDKYVKNYGARLEYSSSFLHGDPAKAINEAVATTGAEMVVMGTHGRTGLSHLLMGSVAENVLKNAKVPVLCVRGS